MTSLGDFKKKLQEVEVLGKLDDVSAYASQVDSPRRCASISGSSLLVTDLT